MDPTFQWAIGLLLGLAGIGAPFVLWGLTRLVTSWTKLTDSIDSVVQSAGVLKYATDEMKQDLEDHELRLRRLEHGNGVLVG